MKITEIEAIPYSIPYHKPLSFATGVLTHANHVLIKIHTSEGFFGISEAVERPMIYGESQQSIVTAIHKWFAPLLIGMDPFAVEIVQGKLKQIVANNTAKGALDIALHDLRGKVLQQPCWRLFGGDGGEIQVTAMLSIGKPEEVAQEALSIREQNGSNVFKIKVGLDEENDLAVVKEVRNVLGDDARLYVDANHGYTAEQALRILPKMISENIEFVEEPNPAEDFIGRAKLSAMLSVPIMADESVPTLSDAVRELYNDAARIISVKTTRTGFTESSKIVALAQALGVRTVLGNQADSVIGTSASLQFGGGYPWVKREAGEFDLFQLMKDQVANEMLHVQNGKLQVPNGPGIGVSINEEKLKYYRIDE
ncbi:hypothetical protein DH09_19625 [Bacillaceae bacterium JMAK1]|nr:hypothetical protein DH09_19625 [Bacillaceae bacterium JMAK1]